MVVIIGVIGFTLAYFSDSITVENKFKTKEYGTTVTEEFVSPDSWTPGTTTEKSVVAKNTGEVDEAVRISYTEKWVAAYENTVLSGWVDKDGNVTDHAEELATDERAAIINFDNDSDWTESNGYYYYNYKLAPGEVTTSFIKSVTFNSIVQSDSDCEETRASGTKTISCTSTGKGYDGATYTLTFNIETVQYDQYKNAWNITNVDIVSEKPATKILRDKANGVNATYSNDTKGEMFVFTHGEGNSAVTDYRYIGDSPNNYVKFNCKTDEETSEEACEIWRIVGVFDVDDGTGKVEQRMKLVRGELLTNNENWNNNDEGSSINEWNGSSLATTLNGTYYESLSTSAKSLIGDAKFYLGGGRYSSTTNYGSAEDMYAWERGTAVYTSDEKTRTTEWTGKVALLYPSDNYYIYAKGVDNNCYNDPFQCAVTIQGTTLENPGAPTEGWIYNSNVKGTGEPEFAWLLSSRADIPNLAFIVSSIGRLYYSGVNSTSQAVRPVVYLTSDIKIDGGTGTENDPYTLKK